MQASKLQEVIKAELTSLPPQRQIFKRVGDVFMVVAPEERATFIQQVTGTTTSTTTGKKGSSK